MKDQSQQPKVLVIDDHPLVLQGIKGILSQLNYNVTTADTAKKALEQLKNNVFDLIMLDINLPDISGKSLIKMFRLNNVEAPILIVSGSTDTPDILWMLKNGAQGFIDKAQPPDKMKIAIETVINGDRYIPAYLNSIDKNKQQQINDICKYYKISKRQKEILLLIDAGKSNKQISHELNITDSTVSSYLKEIYQRLNVHNRTECVKFARDNRII